MKLRGVEIKNIKDEIDYSKLDDVISSLKELGETYQDSYDDLRLDVSIEDEYGSNYVRIMLIGDRKETEEEALKREAKEKRDRENEEKSERAELIKLLAKYGVPI